MPEWMHLAIARISALLTGGKLDSDFQAELDEHLALLTEEFRSQGLSETEARRAFRGGLFLFRQVSGISGYRSTRRVT